ncbi:hypothetical protein CDAR_370521 [Caerostris darwini]|uniref:CCHC-type domain-containing protein n=1 Tax=Caerostris darwini TaxID=1538125 RepID=A0AAV4VFI9_9ARAC|nr:hypothetical protein CDAR_370521 [Caerostris darwini]
MADEDKTLSNPCLLSSIRSFNGENAEEFFTVLENTALLGNWSEIQLAVITTLKLEGRARRFFEASLKGKNLGYQPLKARLIAQFSKPVNFASNFTQFATTVQLPFESVKDFASRLEGVAHKTFGESSVESGDMSQKFRAKIMLSQFLAGLQSRIKAQMVIINPETFEGAVELGERIEIAQEMLVPNVNVLESGNRVHDKVLEAVQASGDTLAKTLNLVNRQLEHLNSRMDKIEAETKSGNGRNCLANREPVTCFHCNRPGHYMRNCYQRLAENRGRGANHRGRDRGNGNDYTYGNQRFSGGNNQPKEETEIKHVKGGNIVGPLVPTVAHVDPNLDVFYSCTLPLIDIVIGGIKCMTLIDSGATMDLIDKSIFHKLKNFVVIEAPPINLKTLSNESLSTKLVIKTSVEIKNVKLPGHFVLAVADLSPSFNVILGLEFLNLHKFTLDCEKKIVEK